MITLITPTGDRPGAWELCKHWMREQKIEGKVRWIIIDDGEIPSDMTGFHAHWEIVVWYPHPKWSSTTGNTQAHNLTVAKRLLREDDSVIFIDDDDYYHPEWLDKASRMLDHADLVGIGNMAFFNVARMTYRRCANYSHALLCATALRGQALMLFWEILEYGVTDPAAELWRSFLGSRTLLSRGEYVVGIKGMPGRPGKDMLSEVSDPAKLRSLIGASALEKYTPYLGGSLE